MIQGVATKVIAASSALTAFAFAMVAGVWAGNSAEAVLARALVAMVVGYVMGMVLGLVAERTIREAAESYKKTRPVAFDATRPGAGHKSGDAGTKSSASTSGSPRPSSTPVGSTSGVMTT